MLVKAERIGDWVRNGQREEWSVTARIGEKTGTLIFGPTWKVDTDSIIVELRGGELKRWADEVAAGLGVTIDYADLLQEAKTFYEAWQEERKKEIQARRTAEWNKLLVVRYFDELKRQLSDYKVEMITDRDEWIKNSYRSDATIRVSKHYEDTNTTESTTINSNDLYFRVGRDNHPITRLATVISKTKEEIHSSYGKTLLRLRVAEKETFLKALAEKVGGHYINGTYDKFVSLVGGTVRVVVDYRDSKLFVGGKEFTEDEFVALCQKIVTTISK